MIKLMRARCHVLHQGRIDNIAGHGAAMIEAVKIAWRAIGVAAMGRLETHDATGGGGDADGAADVGAGGKGREACGQCGA